VAEGKAYLAFDTPEEIEAMRERLKEAGAKTQHYNFATRNQMKNSLSLSKQEVETRIAAGEPYVVRMNMPRKEEIRFYDEIRNWVVIQSSQLDDKVLLKSDGMPTYHLANVVDDHLMGVTHVIRGEEWLSSTPLHVLLYRAFGWEDSMPTFVHLPLILNPNGQGKMSKRMADKLGFSVFPTEWQDPASGNTSSGYREEGYLPEAMFNFLTLLGWNPGDDEELMDHDRLVERFSLDRINKSATHFDLDKLKWFNQNYLRQTSPATLLPAVKAEVEKAGYALPEDVFLTQVIVLMQERVTLLPEIVSQAPYFFETPQSYDEKMASKRWKTDSPELMTALKERFATVTSWEASLLEEAFEGLLAEKEVGKGKVLAPLRLALTGVSFGPGAFDIAALIGREETLKRIDKAVAEIPVS
jgi:glutamyl-tRNA synthetase